MGDFCIKLPLNSAEFTLLCSKNKGEGEEERHRDRQTSGGKKGEICCIKICKKKLTSKISTLVYILLFKTVDGLSLICLIFH